MANWWKRVAGEMSALRDGLSGLWGLVTGSIGMTYKLDSTRVNYKKARNLYDNTEEEYKLGAGFCKKIINSTVGFMGLPEIKSKDEEAQMRLRGFFEANHTKAQRTQLNALKEGDCFIWITREEKKSPLYPDEKKRLVYNIIPPEQVKKINRDPLTGEPVEYILESTHTWVDENGANRKATIKQRISAEQRLIEIEGDPPPDLEAGERPNPWGFIPIVHFKNEGDETAEFGKSDLESVEPFLKAYHDVFMHAIQGSKMHSTPRLKLKLKNIRAFLKDNLGINDPEKFAREGGKINLDGHELLFMSPEEDASFIEVKSATGDATALLEFIFYCIISASETPEFVFGVHTPSSLASTKEQMPVFIQKIERKRQMFADSWKLLCRMALAMISQSENISFSTFETELLWENIDPRDSKDAAEELKNIVEAMDKGVSGGLMSLEAAVEYLKYWIDTIRDYESEDEDILGEKDRILQTSIFRSRLEDAEYLDAERDKLNKVV